MKRDINELQSLLGFRLRNESIDRINELMEEVDFSNYTELMCTATGTLEVFLREKLKDRVFVTLSQKYITDLENWDKKVWLFEIEFLNKDIEILIYHLDIIRQSRYDEPDYNFDVMRKICKDKENEEIMINAIVLLEWVVAEIRQNRMIGAVNKQEFENMDSTNWRISILFNTDSDLTSYKIYWGV